MKKYFVKLLPSQIPLYRWDKIFTVQTKDDYKNNVFPIKASVINIKDDYTVELRPEGMEDSIPMPINYCRKLYICTKEINEGDIIPEGEVIAIKTDPWNKKVLIWKNNDISGSDFIENFYKIIGEISADAKWVKEGYEFDDDEISITKLCRDDSTPPYDSFCFHCSRSSSCGNDEGNKVFIFNKSCQHFH